MGSLHTIGLRYFNIFGPKQNPNNPYAAVIPIFCKHFIDKTKPTINGDGNTIRDFTYVQNAVQANVKAMLLEVDFDRKLTQHEVFNIACGDQISLNEMIDFLKPISGNEINPIYGPERSGDVKHRLASIDKAINLLNYKPTVFFKNGLEQVYQWYLDKRNN